MFATRTGRLAHAVCLALTTAACGALGPPLDLRGDAAPSGPGPQVLSVSPAANAVGVRSDAVIVITFDRTMDEVSTQSAFGSPDIQRPQFEWDRPRTKLTVRPGVPLAYTEGDRPDFPAQEIRFTLTDVARDAQGRPLRSLYQSSFKTLRRRTQTVRSDVALDGYVRKDTNTAGCMQETSDVGGVPFAICVGFSRDIRRPYRGLLTFDLTDLPQGIQTFESAKASVYQYRVDGTPYEVLGALNIEHVIYESKEVAYTVGALARLGLLANSARIGWWATMDVAALTAAVAEDYGARDQRRNRSQYRLTFATDLPDGTDEGHVAKFYTAVVREIDNPAVPERKDLYPRLELKYLLP